MPARLPSLLVSIVTPLAATPEICTTACGTTVVTWVSSAATRSVRFTLPLYNLEYIFDYLTGRAARLLIACRG